MEHRNATVAVIGAGDDIGATIAKKFAAEGFTICAGRRNGDKLVSLVADIEAHGGRMFARSLDARKEADITAFLHEADTHAPLEVCIFNIGANVNFPLLETTERVFRSPQKFQMLRWRFSAHNATSYGFCQAVCGLRPRPLLGFPHLSWPLENPGT